MQEGAVPEDGRLTGERERAERPADAPVHATLSVSAGEGGVEYVGRGPVGPTESRPVCANEDVASLVADLVGVIGHVFKILLPGVSVEESRVLKNLEVMSDVDPSYLYSQRSKFLRGVVRRCALLRAPSEMNALKALHASHGSLDDPEPSPAELEPVLTAVCTRLHGGSECVEWWRCGGAAERPGAATTSSPATATCAVSVPDPRNVGQRDVDAQPTVPNMVCSLFDVNVCMHTHTHTRTHPHTPHTHTHAHVHPQQHAPNTHPSVCARMQDGAILQVGRLAGERERAERPADAPTVHATLSVITGEGGVEYAGGGPVGPTESRPVCATEDVADLVAIIGHVFNILLPGVPVEAADVFEQLDVMSQHKHEYYAQRSKFLRGVVRRCALLSAPVLVQVLRAHWQQQGVWTVVPNRGRRV